MSAVAWNEAIDAPLNVTVRFTFSEIVSVGLGAGEWLGWIWVPEGLCFFWIPRICKLTSCYVVICSETWAHISWRPLEAALMSFFSGTTRSCGHLGCDWCSCIPNFDIEKPDPQLALTAELDWLINQRRPVEWMHLKSHGEIFKIANVLCVLVAHPCTSSESAWENVCRKVFPLDFLGWRGAWWARKHRDCNFSWRLAMSHEECGRIW